MNVCNQDYPVVLVEETNKYPGQTTLYTTEQSQISPRNDIWK